jgi:hypothetical protein
LFAATQADFAAVLVKDVADGAAARGGITSTVP